jgi:hypothetical protein
MPRVTEGAAVSSRIAETDTYVGKVMVMRVCGVSHVVAQNVEEERA